MVTRRGRYSATTTSVATFRPPAAEPWRDRGPDAASRPRQRAVPPGRDGDAGGNSAATSMRTQATPPAARSTLRLAAGDVVVYASHGIGRIESAHAAEGTQPARIILALESGLT